MTRGAKKNGWKNKALLKSQTKHSSLHSSVKLITWKRWLKALPIRSSLETFGMFITVVILQKYIYIYCLLNKLPPQKSTYSGVQKYVFCTLKVRLLFLLPGGFAQEDEFRAADPLVFADNGSMCAAIYVLDSVGFSFVRNPRPNADFGIKFGYLHGLIDLYRPGLCCGSCRYR